MTGAVPRVVVAGVGSGVGKTTVTVGLCRALRARGLEVRAFKCGPDYLDPTYHERATGAVSHNLDGWLMGKEAALATFARAAVGADVAVIEGVMGLFDGASPTSEEGSTAEMAKWLSAPVVLVVDASGMARSLAALVAGFRAFDPDLRIEGVIANRIGSTGHLDLLRKALRSPPSPPPILGGLPKSEGHSFPDRHLGLRTADRDAVPEALFDAWGATVAQSCDLDALLALARSAGALDGVDALAAAQQARASAPDRCRIGLAHDEAFHFYYEDNLRRLTELGAEIVRFSPVHDPCLPAVDGLYIGGGYPEASAVALAGNGGMLADIREFARRGRAIYAECGGLMYLAEAIRTTTGERHAMVGLIPGEATMSDKLEALGYVEVETQERTPLGPAGLRFRGHQFRYSHLADAGTSLAYSVRRRRGGEAFREGYRAGNVLASYVHAHWASNPLVAEGFVRSCADPHSTGTAPS